MLHPLGLLWARRPRHRCPAAHSSFGDTEPRCDTQAGFRDHDHASLGLGTFCELAACSADRSTCAPHHGVFPGLEGPDTGALQSTVQFDSQSVDAVHRHVCIQTLDYTHTRRDFGTPQWISSVVQRRTYPCSTVCGFLSSGNSSTGPVLLAALVPLLSCSHSCPTDHSLYVICPTVLDLPQKYSIVW